MKSLADALFVTKKHLSPAELTRQKLELEKQLTTCPVCGKPNNGVYLFYAGQPYQEYQLHRFHCRCEQETHAKLDERQGICPICRGTYWVLNASGEPKRCKCYTGAVVKQNVNNSLMGVRIQESTFAGWNPSIGNRGVKALCENYVEQFDFMVAMGGIGFTLAGQTANGKTYAAACVSNALLEKRYNVVFATPSTIGSWVKDTFQPNGDKTESEVLRKFTRADLLVLDDLGTETDTDWNKSLIFQVLDTRYSDNLPVIITTNLKEPAIRERYGDRILSRIKAYSPVVNMDKGKILGVTNGEKSDTIVSLIKST